MWQNIISVHTLLNLLREMQHHSLVGKQQNWQPWTRAYLWSTIGLRKKYIHLQSGDGRVSQWNWVCGSLDMENDQGARPPSCHFSCCGRVKDGCRRPCWKSNCSSNLMVVCVLLTLDFILKTWKNIMSGLSLVGWLWSTWFMHFSGKCFGAIKAKLHMQCWSRWMNCKACLLLTNAVQSSSRS